MRTRWWGVLPFLALILWGCVQAAPATPIPLANETANSPIVVATQRPRASETPAEQAPTPEEFLIPVTGETQASTPLPTPTVAPTPYESYGAEMLLPVTGGSSVTPAITRVPTVEPGKVPCEKAVFVKDVTIPDNTVVSPGASFTKTWRLKNVGTCTWTSKYALFFVGGDTLGNDTIVPLNQEVLPGNSVDVSVNMVAPLEPGHYRGNWQLSNPNDEVFGLGGTRDDSFWVDIRILPGEPLVDYDLVAQAPFSNWTSQTGEVVFGSKSTPENGVALFEAGVNYESGTTFSEDSLLLIPDRTSENGSIEGLFAWYKVQAGNHFYTVIGCKFGATACSTTISLAYRLPGNDESIMIAQWTEVYDGKLTIASVDLGFLEGKTIELVLKVVSNGDAMDDQIYLLYPRVLR